MSKNNESDTEAAAAAQFTVDLDALDLTDDDVNGIQNQIIKLIVESVKDKGFAITTERKKEPYVKITFVKAVPRPKP